MSIELIAMRLWTPKSGHFIRPVSAFDEGKIADLPEGKALHLVVTDRPPAKLVHFYWALVAKLVEAGCFAHRDVAHFTLMGKCGRVASATVRNGDVTLIPVSTKEWTTPEWRAYVRDAVRVVLSDVLEGARWPSTRTEVERFCGVRFNEAMEE